MTMNLFGRTLSSLVLGSFMGLVVAASGCGSKIDPAAANATAGCETATDTLLAEGENMLPGRACINCHKAGGQAPEADVRWTVAGTVYGSANSMCNSGGLAGVKVDILKMDGTTVQFSMQTNASGNFYSLQALEVPFKARVSMGGKTQMMTGAMATGNCPSCHQIPPLTAAPGRIYLN